MKISFLKNADLDIYASSQLTTSVCVHNIVIGKRKGSNMNLQKELTIPYYTKYSKVKFLKHFPKGTDYTSFPNGTNY